MKVEKKREFSDDTKKSCETC
ncbi:Protein of unknown function [Lactobacillus helveticus CIRM-BIA 101]|nr:Protein of unknown function [Lactobacillus helveticus CIRM-BIA 103]CDI64635.1 Protein of unknown function [Lactobacillus helveticus CIRM-BIA 101]